MSRYSRRLKNPGTWLLIEWTPHGATKSITDWFEEIECWKDGKFDYLAFGHWRGGGHTILLQRKVLETVDLGKDGDEDTERDLSKTTTFIELTREAQERRAGLSEDPCGWLSPEAVWHPCAYHAHDSYAAYILRKRSYELHRWLRINKYGNAGVGADPNENQAAWLLARRQERRQRRGL